jgi:hypothetical protein
MLLKASKNRFQAKSINLNLDESLINLTLSRLTNLVDLIASQQEADFGKE